MHQDSIRGGLGWGRYDAAMRWMQLLAAALVALSATACKSSQKLSEGGPVDALVYGVLGQERDPRYYFDKIEEAHDPRSDTYAYRSTEDEYLVDKSVDAAEKLGRARYSRLEGQAQVVARLSNMLLEDPVALARTNAATSLTKIGMRLPRYPRPQWAEDNAERGDRFLAYLRALDGLHDANGRLRGGGNAHQKRVHYVRTLGNFRIVDLEVARDALRPFASRPYLIDAQAADLRTEIDTAIVKRMRELIRLSLEAALDAPYDHVRREAVIGLKLLGDAGAEEAVLARLDIETDWQVKSEAVEYLGKMASADGVGALLPLLQAGDPTLRHKSRQALIRIAGRDLGTSRARWKQWAHARYPELALREAKARAAREAAEARARGPERRDPVEPAPDNAPTTPPEGDLPDPDDVLPPADDILPDASDILPDA